VSSVTEPRYRFTNYDGTRLYRTWRAGAIVTDPKEIEWLIARTALIERIEQ
jgi:hypothetical protein